MMHLMLPSLGTPTGTAIHIIVNFKTSSSNIAIVVAVLKFSLMWMANILHSPVLLHQPQHDQDVLDVAS